MKRVISNMCALIQIFFLIALMVQSGLAIKCFNCDSASNELCANMSDPNFVAEECSYDKQMTFEANYNALNHHNRHWLLRISDIYYRKLKNEFDAKMICQKLIGTDEHKQRTVVRRCQLANIAPCNFSRQQTANLNREIECHICDEDGCNGSTNNHVFGMMIGFVSAVAVFKHFVFY